MEKVVCSAEEGFLLALGGADIGVVNAHLPEDPSGHLELVSLLEKVVQRLCKVSYGVHLAFCRVPMCKFVGPKVNVARAHPKMKRDLGRTAIQCPRLHGCIPHNIHFSMQPSVVPCLHPLS
jgi:hypothetical protein